MSTEETVNDEVTEVVEQEAPNEEVATTTPEEGTETKTVVTETATDPEDIIELSDGTKVTAEELVKGYMRQSDYTKKTQDIAIQRKKLEDSLSGLGEISKVAPKETTQPKTVAKYKPEQLEELKSVMSELGYVSKHEMTQMSDKQKREEIVNSFFSKHPEYSQENDPGDVKINAFRQELALYNHADLSVLPKALAKAHDSVSAGWTTDADKAKAIALKLRGKSATVGSGGGQQKQPTSNEKRFTRAQIEVMKEMGTFDNEEPID